MASNDPKKRGREDDEPCEETPGETPQRGETAEITDVNAGPTGLDHGQGFGGTSRTSPPTTGEQLGAGAPGEG